MRKHKLIYSSSYDRGLDILLYLWPDIKARFPEATLDICYGWDGFLARFKDNPERMRWYENVNMMMNQDGITHHGRVGKGKLESLRKECGIWAYPTYFTEIFCITALEMQASGVVPVVCDFKDKGHYTALNETVGSGVIVKGDIKKKEIVDEYLDELLSLMNDGNRWNEESQKGKRFAKGFSWDIQADKWLGEFEKTISEPKVTIVTSTIRRGFWNIMAQNISAQTYKNIEWVVVDDFGTDRKKTMDKYCQKWGIEGRYIKQERKKHRKYSLAQANNKGWQDGGELIVYLQDFIIMPIDGIERLVDIYRHNTDALIAPTDLLYKPRIKPNTESEDWFDGEIDIIGDYIWKNARNKNIGIRESNNPYEFEMNYSAVPKKIIQALNGWYEFFDDALGYDNTEFAFRAMDLGYRLIVDDTNQCIALDHWEPLKENKKETGGHDRSANLNDPRYLWLIDQIDSGKLPHRRNEAQDDSISLKYTLPNVKDKAGWMKKNAQKIANSFRL